MKKYNNLFKQNISKQDSGQILRKKAEAQVWDKVSQSSEKNAEMTSEETLKMYHELLVHQVELEMQNEELRQAQAELYATRTRYFDLYDLAPVGYCTISEKGLILEANLTAATMLGIARGVLARKPFSRFILNEDQDIYYLHNKRLFETGEPHACELRMLKTGGKSFWVHLAAAVAQNGDGAFISRVVMSDITDRKQAEEALIENEQRLIEAQSIARFGRWDLDLTNARFQCSNGISELFEIDQEKFGASYEAFLELIHPDDREMVNQAYANSLKNRTPYENTYRLLMKDGRIKWMYEVRRTDYDVQDHAIRSVGIVQDITERKIIEDVQMFLLQFSHAIPDADFFNSLANYLAVTLGMDYVCIGRLENDCLSARTVSVYSDGRFEDNKVYALKDTPCVDVVEKTICSFPHDVRNLFPHDAVLQEMNAESYIGTTLYNSKGQPTGLITIISRKPIGNLKLAEYLLKLVSILAASELERRQYEEEIIIAKEEAEASNMLKSIFLANMSHEIRTPMGGIIGMLNAVLSTELTDQQQEFLNLAKTSSGVLLRVVKDILDYSMIESERVKFEKSSFNINKIINEVVDLFNVSAKQKGLSLFANINKNIPQNLIGDPMRLRQVLSNLIGNAVKFTDRGSVTISVRKIKCHKKKITIQFDIADTGIGIPEDSLEKLFKSFSQLDNSYSKQFGGTGLGLVISRKLIEMMDGRIWVESKDGVGSTFSCTAVFDLGEEPQADISQTRESAAGKPGDETCRYTILVAEDEEINRKVVLYYLQKIGCHIVAATNGKDAVDLFKKSKIDLVLMDVQMPEMDGFTATKLIKDLGNANNRHVPIIAMTAYALKGDREKCIEAGMEDYITKPISSDELYEKLDKWLGLPT